MQQMCGPSRQICIGKYSTNNVSLVQCWLVYLHALSDKCGKKRHTQHNHWERQQWMILDDVDGDSSNILWSMARTTILNYGGMEKCLHKTIELSDERAIYQHTILCNGIECFYSRWKSLRQHVGIFLLIVSYLFVHFILQ